MPVDPATLRIKIYPADILRRKADEVDPTPEVVAVARQMIAIMHEAPGIGLAAPQVGLPWRLFVADVPADPERNPPLLPDASPPTASPKPEILINPAIESTEGPPELGEEGCLSLPDILGDVPRPPVVTMSWTDIEGERQSRTVGGLLARCWQHELDHLDGVLILDRMTNPSRTRNRTRIRNLERGM
ncbi:MAG: peptide deformylase [Phycisphaeraceae bacterium]|nr:MAG: peptide deformylase [Phycisphaeraceae bacterium]